MVHAAGGLLHVDAVQGPGRIVCDFKALGADLMTLSSHKIGGPQGVGALIHREGMSLDPLIKGGGQERGARAGTENVAGIAGFGAAAEASGHALAEEASRMGALRDQVEAGLKALTPEVVIFGSCDGQAPQYHAVFGAGHEGRNRHDRLRPGRRRSLLGFGLFLGQGRAVPCFGSHGRRSRS